MKTKDIQVFGHNIKMYAPDDMVVHSLNKGPWEMHSLKNWVKVIEKFNVKNVFDIGSYTGIYSLLAASCEVESITAFEPMPPVYERLNENLKLNGFKAATKNVALSESEGKGEFQLTNGIKLPSGSSISDNPNRKTVKKIPIQMERLDKYAHVYDRVELIKIDVERHEVELMKGGMEFLKDNMPIIFIELLDKPEFDKIVNILKSIGYNHVIFSDDKNHVNIETSKYIRGGNYIISKEAI